MIKSLKFKRLQDLYPDIIGYKISEKRPKVAVDGIDKCGWKGYRKK